MSKISRKIILVVLGILIALTAIVITVALVMSGNQTDELMVEQSTVGIHTLEHQIDLEQERLIRGVDTVSQGAAAAAMSGNTGNLETAWAKVKERDTDFIVVTDENGAVVWKSENCPNGNFDFAAGLAGTTKAGISSDSGVALALECVAPVKYNNDTVVGAVVIGMDLSDCTMLDEVKSICDTEVTIFAGPTRYATSIIGADGNRVVGTDMADNVKKTVIDGESQ